MRLFFAIWPPRQTAQALAQWANQMAHATGGRTVGEQAIHLTLAFLGDVDAMKAAAAARTVRGLAFNLPIEIGQYWKHNKIVWAGPTMIPPALGELAQALHHGLRHSGFTLEERPFAAHVTLIRKAALPNRFPPLPPSQWPVREFALVCSTPTRAGSGYETIERFPLRSEEK